MKEIEQVAIAEAKKCKNLKEAQEAAFGKGWAEMCCAISTQDMLYNDAFIQQLIDMFPKDKISIVDHYYKGMDKGSTDLEILDKTE